MARQSKTTMQAQRVTSTRVGAGNSRRETDASHARLDAEVRRSRLDAKVHDGATKGSPVHATERISPRGSSAGQRAQSRRPMRIASAVPAAAFGIGES